jgi:hypothetical protein
MVFHIVPHDNNTFLITDETNTKHQLHVHVHASFYSVTMIHCSNLRKFRDFIDWSGINIPNTGEILNKK